MPFKSRRQARFMFAAEDRGELSKGTAMRWAHETKSIKRLPEKKHTKLSAYLHKLAADVRKRKLKKKADMVKWTAAKDELAHIKGPGLGDTDSSSATQFPYGPEANPASQ